MLIKTDENQIRALNPVTAPLTERGMQWLGFFFRRLKGEGLGVGYRYPSIIDGGHISDVNVGLSHWHMTGFVDLTIDVDVINVKRGQMTITKQGYGGQVPVSCVNNKDTKTLIRCLYGDDPMAMEILMRDSVIRSLDEVTG